MGTLTVKCDKSWISGGKLYIYVNDENQGVLKDGESTDVDLEPGDFDVQMSPQAPKIS